MDVFDKLWTTLSKEPFNITSLGLDVKLTEMLMRPFITGGNGNNLQIDSRSLVDQIYEKVE